MSIIAEPKGQARAAKDAAAEKAWHEQQAEIAATQARQAAHAAQTKLNKLARKNTAVSDLVDEHAATVAALDVIREKHGKLEATHAELARQASSTLEENAKLRQELDAAKAEVAKLAAALEETTGKLAAALAAKKAGK